MSRLALCATLILAFAISVRATCTSDPDTLRAERNAILPVWTTKVNGEWDTYQDITDTYADNSWTVEYVSVGSFGPKLVAQEYGRIVWNSAGTRGGSFFGIVNSFVPNSVQWLSTDVVQLTYISNFTVDYTSVGGIKYEVDGLANTEILEFKPCNTSILVDFNQLDPSWVIALQAAAGTVPPSSICAIVQEACPVGSIYEQYPSYNACLAFMSSIDPTDYCPFSETSNTTNCRFLHAQNAVYLPAVHCIHTAIDSPVCYDSCFPDCDGCDVNAHCAVASVALEGISYQCQCNEGFVGNGLAGQCTAVTCPSGGQWQCPGTYNYVACNSDHLCGCQPSFEWVPTSPTDTCQCPEGTYLNYNGGQAECLSIGRCREQWQCASSWLANDYSNVQCTSYGTNAYLPEGVESCVCNPGFEGNFDIPCECPSPSTVTWSNRFNGNVCLAAGQCTETSQCPYGKTCHNAAPIGTCS